MGIVMNKADKRDMTEIYTLAKEAGLDILGSIPMDNSMTQGSITRDSDIVTDAVKQFYFRLNLPQENNK